MLDTVDVIQPNLDYIHIRITVDPFYPWTSLFAAQFPYLEGIGGGTSTQQVYAFAGIDDEGVTESLDPQYSPTEIPGRSEMYQTYMGSANREVSLQLQFVAQQEGSSSPSSSEASYATPKWVTQSVRWLQGLMLPVYDSVNDIAHAPPPVLLEIGGLFMGRCIVTAANPEWRGPFEPSTMFPYHANVNVTFRVVQTAFNESAAGLYLNAVSGLKAAQFNRFFMHVG